ncbi:GLPGLI family protein [Neptunitalea chrysea]|uniref:GLPGLI family protein n=1 Tax=Neptunitalea chrysea TaxID=1647581 RepID=A0A9W6EUJ2_9FLAO|nr:GLPGLI family protein [Neptunitalea chrysea]GLB51397.1 GLPGLI family protein [Neptunitalea chrysea]
MNYFLGLLISTFTCASAIAQQGEATYLEHVKASISFDSTTNAKMTNKMRQAIDAQLKSLSQKEYTLTFTPTESIYKQEEQLDTPTPASSNVGGVGAVFISSSGGGDLLYKNVKENKFVNQTELMGKLFLIKDTLTTRKWKLGSETKTIGNYTCYKATIDFTVTHTQFTFGNEEEEKTVEKTKTLTAWYTPEIPVSNGPEDYQGLPGLILEVHEGNKTLVCNKITLSKENDFEIKIPSKGKKVTQTEYDEISEKKMKQFIEQQKNNHRNRNGKGISISISK